MYQQFKTEARQAGAKASLVMNSLIFIKKSERYRIVAMQGDWLTAAREALAELA